MGEVLVRVLGPVMVTADGAQVPLPGAIPTRILAMLTTNLTTGLRTDALIDGVWGAGATEAALATLQSHVARLRRASELPCDARAGLAILPPPFLL